MLVCSVKFYLWWSLDTLADLKQDILIEYQDILLQKYSPSPHQLIVMEGWSGGLLSPPGINGIGSGGGFFPVLVWWSDFWHRYMCDKD